MNEVEPMTAVIGTPKESEKEQKARTKRLIELGGFIEGQLSEESISI
jgi:hypothetical protein